VGHPKKSAVSQKPAADFFISSQYISTILQIDRQGQHRKYSREPSNLPNTPEIQLKQAYNYPDFIIFANRKRKFACLNVLSCQKS
jgi:hypothetical protein